MTVLGAIIAGGAARRFGGDKGAALLGGTALVDHVAAALAAQTDTLVIVGRPWPGLSMLEDRPRAGEGPLGGLAAALYYGRAQGHEAVLCAGCDTLPIPPDLRELLSPGPAVVEDHWLTGLWPTRLSDDLDRWLSMQSDRSIRSWMRQAGARRVALDMPFININTPDALAEAEKMGGFPGSPSAPGGG